MWFSWCCLFFFQAEDGIRDLVRSRGLGDVYKRQLFVLAIIQVCFGGMVSGMKAALSYPTWPMMNGECCLLYTSDAADERSSVDLGGRRIIKKKNRGDRGRDKTRRQNDKMTLNT
mgnify:CR=1 FL=1